MIQEAKAEKRRRESTLVIGAAGAIGKRLCGALAARGHRVIATDRMAEMPKSLSLSLGELGTCVGGVDVRDAKALQELFEKHADANTTVWNLAAPLSVDTALNPAVAQAVTVGGMKNVLNAMRGVGARRICFTDSIGSFGAAAPRRGATASWLVNNPTQDPGSDYGRQKRACRELMEAFSRDQGGDARFAVLPGVLHTNAVWGNGTTEYALDALLAAPHQATTHGLPCGDAFVCPVDPDVSMPMIFSDDLMRGLVALQEAEEDQLAEPQRGYCLPGLSFTPNELFAEIRRHYPGFGFRVALNDNMNKFARLWPDDLDPAPPLRDLGYAAEVGLQAMVSTVLAAHDERNVEAAAAFRAIDDDCSNVITRQNLENYIRQHVVRGRERYGNPGDASVNALVDRLMEEMGSSKDGHIEWLAFSEWNRSNTVHKVVVDSLHTPL